MLSQNFFKLEASLVEVQSLQLKEKEKEKNLYEQVDGAMIGSSLGPLMANLFMCSIKE